MDLRSLSPGELNYLLDQQTAEWDRELDWDFSGVAGRVRRFFDERRLNGAALMHGREVVGYGYITLEDRKGLICDLYTLPGWRGGDWEIRLFRVLLGALIEAPGVRRIECQFPFAGPALLKTGARDYLVHAFERLLLDIATASLPPGDLPGKTAFQIQPWADRHHDAAATVISLAYENHIDSQISDQYRTRAGARSLVQSLVHLGGCGAFCPAASHIAFDRATERPAGIVLASFVSPDVAHITQLCITPHTTGQGLGYELLRRCAAGLRAAGARRITLTVTSANNRAVRLYQQFGFRELRRFFAYSWERPITASNR